MFYYLTKLSAPQSDLEVKRVYEIGPPYFNTVNINIGHYPDSAPVIAKKKKQETSVSDCSACDVELHYIVHPSPR
jgi:hypothetical protein